MKNIYVLSGLGADERIFKHINFEHHNVTFINWILPLKNETIEAYSKRLSEKIVLPNPILIGLSFGGMMAVEIAKYITTEKIIIISSAKNKFEIPFFYRFFGKLMLHKIAPMQILIKLNFLTNKFFAVRKKEDKLLIQSMLRKTNITILKWSLDKIVCLKNTTVHNNLFHIHGNKDCILPLSFIKANIIIDGGTHLMVLDKPIEVQQAILTILK